MSDTPKREVKTTDTVFKIINLIHENQGATLAELDAELDLAKSTIHDHVVTLESKEYLRRTDDKYTLSLKFLYHGISAKNQLEISRVGQPVIEDLAKKTGEVSWIIVEEHGRAVYLNNSLGEKAIQTHASVGGRAPLHHLASGKLILAHLSDDRIDEIIDEHGLPQLTPHTITDRDELEEELDKVREQGFALNNEETITGLRAIGTPVLHDDTILGAITVSGPASRLTLDRCHDEIKPLLFEATNELELKLQYPSG